MGMKMDFFGLSNFELLVIAGGALSSVFWAAAVYSQVKRGADDIEDLKEDIHSFRSDFKNETANLYRLIEIQGTKIREHEVGIAVLWSHLGIDRPPGSWQSQDTGQG
jgi:hypothetical protein